MVVPRRLSESGKRHWMCMADPFVCFTRLPHLNHKLRAQQPVGQRHWLKHDGMSDNLAAVRSHYFRRRNLARLLTNIKIGSTVKVNAPFRQIDATLSIMREVSQEIVSNCNYLVRLLTCLSDFPSDLHILTLVKH